MSSRRGGTRHTKKGRNVLRAPVRVRYGFIEAHQGEYDVATMCRVLDVARSGFYRWTHKPRSARDIADEKLLECIRASYVASGGIYGSPRIFRDLRENGESCGRHQFARLMRENKLRAVRGYKFPGKVYGRPSLVAANVLQRGFCVAARDTAWVTDITYIRTWHGWLYLAVVIDLFSRRVVGWSMKPTSAKEVALDALLMALWRRKPKAEVLIHSDQESPYSSNDWRRFCVTHSLRPSMSRRGN
ncbi:MAG: IS3 family transposase [Deltaproteobacteria bacterium]|nr:MAG: IS3 family transposase [Deltaproteobacteria bacterium]